MQVQKIGREISVTIIESSARLSDEVTDDALVQAVRNGDEFAFEQIFERHKTRVARVAGKFFTRVDKIEEIAQETFTKAYFALETYVPQPGSSFAAWLARIAINCCYDELRRAQRRPADTTAQISGAEIEQLSTFFTHQRNHSNAESRLISRDLANKLLARLSPEDRLALMLLEVEQLSVKEIAEITDWSVAKVKVRMHRARLSLRRVVKELM